MNTIYSSEFDLTSYWEFVESNEITEFPPKIVTHVKKNGDVIKARLFTKLVVGENGTQQIILIDHLAEPISVDQKLSVRLDETRFLATSLQKVREEERTSMARDIHDHLGQMLTVLKMDISRIKSKIIPSDTELNEKVETILESTNKIMATVRSLASQLRPSVLDDFGLAAAIDWLCAEYRRASGKSCVFSEEVVDELKIEKDTATAIFRICQESLNNILKHADATMVQIKLGLEGSSLRFSISDNGKGFNPESVKSKKTLGLIGIKERIALLKGEFSLASTPGNGTEIVVKVKL